MKVVVGIDIGGSTTKIAGFLGDKMLKPIQITASDAKASLFGAFGSFLDLNNLQLEDIGQVNLTGVGASKIKKKIYGLPTYKVDEFDANGLGGGFFSNGLKEFMVVSMGTGTSYVGVKDGVPIHFGGIGIGGGTIIGLSKLMLSTREIDKIVELANQGDLSKVDLRVGDISNDPLPGLDLDITASNFAKVSSRAIPEDKAIGILHMVVETICQTAALIAQNTNIKDFILIGNLTNLSICEDVCRMVEKLFPEYHFIIPDNGEYGTAIGSALCKKTVKIE